MVDALILAVPFVVNPVADLQQSFLVFSDAGKIWLRFE